MGCCGKAVAQIQITPQAVEGESVLVRYAGPKGATFQVPGRATGKQYTFNNRSLAVQVVDAGDASYILALPHFVLA